jgi:UDP-N-acetylmuramate dehydrogenase
VDTMAVKAGLAGRFKGTMIEGAPLSGFTTYGIGGPADFLARPVDLEDLKSLLAAVAGEGVPLLVLGRGSNVLISDRGFRGVVAVIGREMGGIERDAKHKVEVESGCSLDKLINWAIDSGLGGLEGLSGIPGSTGGAVRMNAGALDSSIGEWVERVYVLSLRGNSIEDRNLDREEMGFSYRRTELEDSDIIYKVKLKLQENDKSVLAGRRKEALSWRKANQPIGQPSAGSVFRNPRDIAAGELIDRCGLKGMRVGGAKVSEKHANFIVNTGGASAEDVYRLIELVKTEVSREQGVDLKEEIRLVGMMGEGGS